MTLPARKLDTIPLENIVRISRDKECLCPGCYWDHAPGSELCDRCEYAFCTGEVTRHD